MSLWYAVLYVGAAIIALRSFIQLATNHRAEFEQKLVEEELRRHAQELERAKAEAADEHESAHDEVSAAH